MTRPSDAASVSDRPGWSGPPPGGPGGPYNQPGPRLPPPPSRRLTPAQGSRLAMIAGVIVVLGALVGLLATMALPTKYAARTLIEYHVSLENASEFLRTDRNMTTQTVLLTSRSVLGPVAEQNGVSPDVLADNVNATLIKGTNAVESEIIQVDVLSSSRDSGVTLANAIAKQYLQVVEANSPKAYIQQQLDDAKKQLSSSTGASAANAQTRINTLQGQLDIENMTGNSAKVVVPAYSVAAPAEPNRPVAIATGALLGILVAGLAAIFLSRRWTRS